VRLAIKSERKCRCCPWFSRLTLTCSNRPDNIAFGLRLRRLAKSAIADRVGRVLQLVDLAEMAARFPAQLSGGQQQRVAIARSLVHQAAAPLRGGVTGKVGSAALRRSIAATALT
jgi:ABC-type ATPase involved in cell division